MISFECLDKYDEEPGGIKEGGNRKKKKKGGTPKGSGGNKAGTKFK